MSGIIPLSDETRREVGEAVRCEIMARYQAEWNACSGWERWKLNWKIDAEVRREVARRLPPGALYGKINFPE